MQLEPLSVTLKVIEVLEDLDIPYLIGGSLASTVHGLVRTTLNSDLVAEMQLEHVQPFIKRLRDQFYTDEGMIRDAIERHSNFNLIHLESMYKVDVFIPRGRAFDKSQFQRAEQQKLFDDSEQRAYFAGAEDIILAKLEWYRLGDEASERQWSDVQGVIKVQGDRLDLDYLRKWAAELGVVDLLQRALDTKSK